MSQEIIEIVVEETIETYNIEVFEGVSGASSYEVAVEQGFLETKDEWLASLKGDQGIQGIQGVKGDAGVRYIHIIPLAGTTTTATNYDFGTGCTIDSTTASAHTIAKAGGGTASFPNLIVSYSTASPTSTFYATGSSIDLGNNTNWTFGEIPISSSFIPIIIIF